MSEISLTASMRSNLLSLQQISKLQDSTQLRLSTGLKVNSAIDNPSSYYTASSLNNRAEDLSALLDSMGQSVQTIKAATEGIEKAEDLLSQMKAIAEQVNTGVYVPEKSYFEKLVGANGAVVTNAEELRAAVDSGKEEICVYGKIDLGDISTSGGLSLQENQKLVGVNYYGNFGTEGEEFSGISATATVKDKNLIDINETGCLVSDLNLSYENSNEGGSHVIYINKTGSVTDLKNLTIKADFTDTSTVARNAIYSQYGTTNIDGKINLEVSGRYVTGIYGNNIEILGNSDIKIKTSGSSVAGIRTGSCNINSGARLNITTEGEGIYNFGGEINIYSDTLININSVNYGLHAYGKFNIASGAQINIQTKGSGVFLYDSKAVFNISGNLNIISSGYGITNAGNATGNSVNITSSAKIYFNTGLSVIYNGRDTGNGPNTINIASGAKIAVEKDGQAKWYEVKEDYHDENTSTTINNQITADNIETTLNVAETEAWKTAGDIIAEEQQKQEQENAAQAEKEAEEQANRAVYQKQYNNALSQYDSLIKDSSYKGVNLLQADDLKVIFNENRSSTLEVSGVDLSSDKIGMMTADWTKAKDVQTSLDQIINAKNTLRSASTKLGNYYSIITTREDFTENLINVLQEGADKLTLADMNEESANMLSLQTRQQLAINSLSLASQSSQAVLRLF